MICSIDEFHFLACQKSIEKTNLKNPSKKILVMNTGRSHRHSHVSGLLLREYYARVERQPKLGMSQRERDFFFENNANEEGNLECKYCKTSLSRQEATLDHFVPQYFGGRSHFFNLVVSCSSCNTAKGSIYPIKMPKTYNLFLQKSLKKEKFDCPSILSEIKEHHWDSLSSEEQRYLKRVSYVEFRWRNENKAA